MGLPMARSLAASGFNVCGFDIRPPDEFGDFNNRMIVDPGEFVQSCDVLISVVRDQLQTDALCFDEQAVFRNGTYPDLLVVSSTLSPRYIHSLRNRLPEDVELVDAPMSGAPHAAAQGELTFMCGGSQESISLLTPLFNAMGKHIHHLGALGAGMTAKVLNNYVAASSTVAVRRVYEMAAALGFDRDVLRDVMSHSSGSTWFGDRYELISWAREGYEPANTIGILEKDVLSALDAVKNLEIEDCPLDEAILKSLLELEPDKQGNPD
jgi:3-hydroxyisobutyrate dehydrogenase